MMRLKSCVLLFLAVLARPAAAEIVVGVAGPMAGAFQPVGEAMVAGVEVVAARLNAGGGVLGEELTVVALDDRCDARTGEAVANQLAGRGARVVIGHACTAAAIPAATVYDGAGIVFLSPTATNPRLTDEGIAGVFRLAPRSDRQGAAVAAHLARARPGGRIGLVHDGSVYGQGFVDGVRAALEGTGLEVVMTEGFTPGEKSQNNLVGKLQDAGLSAVVIGALHADAAVIVLDMRARGLEALVVGSEALAVEEFRLLAGPTAEGVLFTLPALEATADAAATIRSAGQEPVPALAAAGAALEIWAAAVSSAGTADAAAVRAALAEGRFDTLVGPVSFDARGDRAEPGYRLYAWRDGAPQPAE